ncbi:PREDICTED: rab proteins geranylgeranyltransferase component A 2-like [Branchiostoma belcheri]|uniref:Rab proteins geranylgeranyltransferase component A 2-like n=1 Tax=Branchiostoma belcheri TaxID=7741 RepID=A0A6P4Y7T6_BRABE|nr:PREDICTED: rab proteins geranylgeranyltransferase component A 2-like [Branchiostoma belcheri]
MADELPTEFDAIVLGTGMAESILAAALARCGQKVLHLDRNDYYSGDWATFNWDGLQRWITRQTHPVVQAMNEAEGTKPVECSKLEEGETAMSVPQQANTISNLEMFTYVREKAEELPPVEKESQEQSETVTDKEEEQTTTEETQQQIHTTEDSEQPKDVGEQSGEAAAGSVTEETVSDDKSDDRCEEEKQDSPEEKEQEKKQDSPEADKKDRQEEEKHDSPAPGGSGVQQEEVQVKADPPKKVEPKKWTMDDIHKEWRRFNIDLSPKMLFGRGSLVELLITSNISRYCEFKAVSRILTLLNGKLEQVPCSRADVFSSKFVTVLEKRMLMKFLTFCVEYEQHSEDYQGWEEKPFSEYLQSRQLTPNLQHFIFHAIAMATRDATTLEGLKSTQRFLRSLGRYGNTPFLWPLYGPGELPQCFCRMCAVFAGIYCLRRAARELIIDKDSNKCKGIVCTEGQRISCRWMVMQGTYVPQVCRKPESPAGSVSRGIFFTDRSMKASENEQITLLSVPPAEGSNFPVRAVELGNGASACPKGMFVVHLTSQGTGSAQAELQPAAEQLFQPLDKEDADTESEKPKVLWCVYFNQLDTTDCDPGTLYTGLPENIVVTSGPGVDLGYEHAVQQARRLFEQMCPGEEFLPAAPNPEDIIYEDDDGYKSGEAPSSSDNSEENGNDSEWKPDQEKLDEGVAGAGSEVSQEAAGGEAEGGDKGLPQGGGEDAPQGGDEGLPQGGGEDAPQGGHEGLPQGGGEDAPQGGEGDTQATPKDTEEQAET